MLRQSTIVTSAGPLRMTESDGGGTPILMIHGTGSSSLAFGHQFDSSLAEMHRLIAIDLPGHGQSADALNPATDYTMPGLTHVVQQVIEQQKLEDLVIVGWSLGGHIGIELLNHPAVSALMLTGTPPVGRGTLAMLRAFQPSWDMLLASKEYYSQRDIARFVSLCFPYGTTPELLEAVRRSDGRARSAAVRSMSHGEISDQRRVVEESSKPVAIVHGRQDPFLRVSYLESLRNLWRGGPKIIENAGHAVFWDQPQIYNTLLASLAADGHSFRSSVPQLRQAS
jgi:pimeloyl-ACP methyl ester carboxylesterase